MWYFTVLYVAIVLIFPFSMQVNFHFRHFLGWSLLASLGDLPLPCPLVSWAPWPLPLWFLQPLVLLSFIVTLFQLVYQNHYKKIIHLHWYIYLHRRWGPWPLEWITTCLLGRTHWIHTQIHPVCDEAPHSRQSYQSDATWLLCSWWVHLCRIFNFSINH